MTRNPELDHEFTENKKENQPGTAGFVYIDENYSRAGSNVFTPLEGPQMTSLTTMGNLDANTRSWKRILGYAIALAIVMTILYIGLRLAGVPFYLP